MAGSLYLRFTPNGVQAPSANQWAPALSNHDPNPPLPVELPVIDEDSDAWWSNSRHGFSQVPIAVAALALATSVAIAGSFIHQDEKPFPNSLGGMEELRVVAVGAEPLPQVFLADEEIVPRPALADDEGWTGWRQPYAAVAPAITADDEIVPQQPRALEGDDGWVWQQPYTVAVALAITADDDVIVAQAVTSLAGGESMQIAVIGDDAPPFVFCGDEEIVPQSAVVVVDDAGGGWPTWQQQYRAVVALPAIVAGDEIVQAPAFVPDEDYWLDLRAERIELVVTNFDLVGSGGPTQAAAAPLQVLDEYWLAPRIEIARPLVPDFWFNDELAQPVAPSDDPGGAGDTPGRKLETPSIWQWDVADELPTAAAPLQIVEPEWQVYSPPWPAPKPLYLPDPEQAVPSAAAVLAINEPEWQVYTPAWQQAQPLYLPDPEQAFAAPSQVAEDEWQVYTPPLPVARVPQPWQCDEDLPRLTVVESDWQVYTPPLLDARQLFKWQVEDEIGTPPPPLRIVEADWQVYTPPLLAAKYPDPWIDDIPNGGMLSIGRITLSDRSVGVTLSDRAPGTSVSDRSAGSLTLGDE